MRLILTLLGMCIITGCSTTPVRFEVANPIPQERVYAAKLIEPSPEKETVKFVRDLGFTGSGCTHTIFIDNDKAFAIRAGEAIAINLKPGNHFFRLDLGAGICPNESYSQSTYLTKGGPQTYRVSISSNFNIMLTRIQ